MPKSPKKQRLSVYLDPAVMRRLAEHAARRDHSRSLIAEAAIESFLSPDAAERQEAATTKRLDQLDRRMTRLERDVGISVEMLAVFVRFWVATTPADSNPLNRWLIACFCASVNLMSAREQYGPSSRSRWS